MKKLALAVIATAFIGIGNMPVSAQEGLPVECQEGTEFDGTEAECINFYTSVAVSPPVENPSVGVLPPVAPVLPPVAAAPPVAQTPGPLPRTGSSISPLLGMGALLLVGGGIIVVGTRRRSTATAN